MCETGMVLSELSHMLKNVRRYAKKRRAVSPLAQFASSSYQLACPYGVVLVMSPWNYPLMLALDPVIDAIAAGNTVVIKPSAYAPAVSAVLERLIAKAMPETWGFVVTGGRAENAALLECAFDYIFFTGGVNVGRLVMEKAAQHLTPVTLELGGKSPCIVDKTAKIDSPRSASCSASISTAARPASRRTMSSATRPSGKRWSPPSERRSFPSSAKSRWRTKTTERSSTAATLSGCWG